MKRAIMAFLAILSALVLHAQRSVAKWECGPEIGFNIPMVYYIPVKNDSAIGSEIKFEIRYNLDNEMDFGVEFFRCVTARLNMEDYVYHDEDGEQIYYNNRMTVMMNGVAIGGDYNVHRGERFSFFAGCMAGISMNAGPNDYVSIGVVMTPRIGMELFNRIRLGIQSRIGYRYANNVGLSIGYSFGGKP